jgi:radical SAM superfamily enzyme YgiQ (UPF0313 family)
MPTRVLIISDNRCSSPYPVYPLGAAYVTADLQQAGHEARIIDLAVPGTDLEDIIRSFSPEYIGLSIRNIDDCHIVNTRFYGDDIAATVRRIRRATLVPLVLGGSGFSIFPRQLMSLTGADYGIQGEGETAMTALVDALSSRGPVDNIPGLIYPREGKTIANGSITAGQYGLPLRPDDLCAWYIRESSMLNIQTQRGCCCTCTYCSYPLIEGRVCRFRPADEIGEEVAQIARTGARYFFITDSVFNTFNDHCAAVCEAIIKQSTGIEFGCFLRPVNLTRDLLRLMARAGLRHIEFGTDSLCDPVLKEYGKSFTFDDIAQSSEMALQENIRFAHFLILGGPGETADTIRQTYANSRKLKKTVFFPFIGMRLYPGTALNDRAVRESAISPDRDLLSPFFYLSPDLSVQSILGMMGDFQKQSRNWIVGDPHRC